MDVIDAVRNNADIFLYRMRDSPKPDERKFLTLLSEVGELADALKGKHEHPKEVELIQIAGICINWLRTMGDFDLDDALLIANHVK
jgi:NTP pyrophosphatase (non-canonical NTP hydrolase)